MNILIVGSGGVASYLAKELDLAGHAVSILADTEADFSRLNSFADYQFGGIQFTGVALDLDVLVNAGIKNVDAVACVTPDENINLMVAQIAITEFKVKKVICRVVNPSIGQVFREKFGLQIVCSTDLTVEEIEKSIINRVDNFILNIGKNVVEFEMRPAGIDQAGKRIDQVLPINKKYLVGVLKQDTTFILAAQNPSYLLSTQDSLAWASVSEQINS